LVIHRKIDDRHSEGNTLGYLGEAYRQLGDARRAIGYYEQALAIRREIGDRRGEGSDLCNLGSAYAQLGDARRAIGYYEQALVLSLSKHWLSSARLATARVRALTWATWGTFTANWTTPGGPSGAMSRRWR
jgi:tetratricopeptide (TPR) repeat protein